MNETIPLKSFLLGYSYAIVTLYVHPENKKELKAIYLDSQAMDLKFNTNSGEHMHFCINRGISPLGGRVPWVLTHFEESFYDVYKGWVSDVVWLAICKLHKTDEDEVRLTYNEIEQLVTIFGGINLFNNNACG
jgi:hypothetical protein